MANEKIFKKGPSTLDRGWTQGSVSEIIKDGAALMTVVAIVSMSKGIIFISMADVDVGRKAADDADVDGATNAFAVWTKRKARRKTFWIMF
mmetsp:Transcript_5653/g.8423  ORF Transcript_5653/g.8423 Transcript_5653/m.8423 type:complete len:91 (-) Transcript_5653:7-279(-)